MNKLATAIIGVCIGGALIAPVSTSAKIKLSQERYKKSGRERFWQVRITCDDSSKKIIKRILGYGRSWCSAEDSELCDNSKFALSRTLCGIVESAEPEEISENAVVAVVPDDSAIKENIRTELMREQVQIEEQRILIEQKRLELVQEELRLKKQKSS